LMCEQAVLLQLGSALTDSATDMGRINDW